MRVPASYTARYYDVTVFVRVDTAAETTVKPIIDILHASCKPVTTKKGRSRGSGDKDDSGDDDDTNFCKASGSSHTGADGAVFGSNQCTHVSCLLQVIRNLPRPAGCGAVAAPTSELCKWVQRGDGPTLPKCTELRKFEFRKMNCNREQARRKSAAADVSTRPLCVPFPRGVVHHNTHLGASARLWDEMMAELRTSFVGDAAASPGGRHHTKRRAGGMGAAEADAEAVAARFSGTPAIATPPPVRGAQQDGVSGAVTVLGRSSKKVKVRHLDQKRLLDPHRIVATLAAAQGPAGASAAKNKRFALGSAKAKADPCVCGCGKDAKGSGFKPHKEGSGDRRNLFESLGMERSRIDEVMDSKHVRVHSDHFTPSEIKTVYKKNSSEVAYRQLQKGALRNEMPQDELSKLLSQIDNEPLRAKLMSQIADVVRQGDQSQRAHADALRDRVSSAEMSHEAICGQYRHKIRAYTSFYSVRAFNKFLDLLDGGEDLFSSIDPNEIGEEIAVVVEQITSRYAGLNVGDWVAPVVSAGGMQRRSSGHEPVPIPADTVVQVIARAEDGDGVVRVDVLDPVSQETFEGVKEGVFVPATRPEPSASGSASSSTRKSRAMGWKDAVCFVLYCLRTGTDVSDEHARWGLAYSTAHRYYAVYLQALRHRLEALFPYPTREQLLQCCPKRIKEQFPGREIQAIIDCHEQPLEMPTDLTMYRSCFSQYKHGTTAKYLGAIAPSGACIDISEPRGGCCSDKELTIASGILDRSYEGMTTLADKGFMMHAQFTDVMHELLTPPEKRRGVATFSTDEMNMTHVIAGPRVHVERAFRRVQEWKCLGKRVKLTQADLAGSVFSVCARMSNFDRPLIREGDLLSVAEQTWGLRDSGGDESEGEAMSDTDCD